MTEKRDEAIKIMKESVKGCMEWSIWIESNSNWREILTYKDFGDAKFFRGYADKYELVLEELQSND